MRFLSGFLFAVVVFVIGAYIYVGKDAIKDPCFGRCSDGTRCASTHCIPSFSDKPAVVAEPKKGHRGKRTLLTKDGVTSAEPEKKLLPGDDKMSTVGDALGRPEHIDLTEGGDDGKELQQSEIDRVWSGIEPHLSHCITDALGDWPLDSGKLEVSYRIEKDGTVKKVRLQAPQLLLRNGLYACMKPKIAALHFPASGGASVVTFPFQIQ